jgi:hypothetical protein
MSKTPTKAAKAPKPQDPAVPADSPGAEGPGAPAEKIDLDQWDSKLTLVQKRFLDDYARRGSVPGAAQAAGVSRYQHYHWLRKKGPEGELYGAEFKRAEEYFGDHLEAYARAKGFTGDTTMVIFLLKAHKPDKYGDKLRIQRQLETMSDDDLEKIIHGNKDVEEPAPDSAG